MTVIEYRIGEAPLTWRMLMFEVLSHFQRWVMKTIIKQGILFMSLLFILNGCSHPSKSLPGIYAMNENAYAAYDGTTLSAKQVETAIRRYQDNMAIIIVKGDRNFIWGDNESELNIDAESINTSNKGDIINPNAIYDSHVLRDTNNDIVAIKFIERKS